jgi:hypothetical protein
VGGGDSADPSGEVKGAQAKCPFKLMLNGEGILPEGSKL